MLPKKGQNGEKPAHVNGSSELSPSCGWLWKESNA